MRSLHCAHRTASVREPVLDPQIRDTGECPLVVGDNGAIERVSVRGDEQNIRADRGSMLREVVVDFSIMEVLGVSNGSTCKTDTLRLTRSDSLVGPAFSAP
jgi:hypothetical protein